MTGYLRQFCKRIANFVADHDGVAMTEAIVAVPFLTLFAAGIIEFGSLFWQREQMETGLREAARYMARCRHTVATCETTARNLAYYGTTTSSAPLRVLGWNGTNSPITFTQITVGTQDIVTARTVHDFVHSPIFGYLGIGSISISASHSQRVM